MVVTYGRKTPDLEKSIRKSELQSKRISEFIRTV